MLKWKVPHICLSIWVPKSSGLCPLTFIMAAAFPRPFPVFPGSLYVCSNRQNHHICFHHQWRGRLWPQWRLSLLGTSVSSEHTFPISLKTDRCWGPLAENGVRERVWAGMMTHLLCRCLQLASKPFRIETLP